MYLNHICMQIADYTAVEKLNIWELKINLKKKNGNVYKVNAQGEDYSVKPADKNELIIPMACYFSMG